MQQASMPQEGRDLQSLLFIAWRRKWIVLIPTIVGLIAGLVIGHPKVLRPLYKSSAQLLLDFPEPVNRNLQDYVPANQYAEQLNRIQSLLQSNDFLLKVGKVTRMSEDPGLMRWVEKNRKRYPGMSDSDLKDLRLTQFLRANIRYSRSKGGENIVVIDAIDLSADRACELAQNLANGVIEANRSEEIERVRALHDFSLEQLAVYKERLNQAEDRLDAFRRGLVVGQLRSGGVDELNVKEVRRIRNEVANDLERTKAEVDGDRAALRNRSPNSIAALASLNDSRWDDALKDIGDTEVRYAREIPGNAVPAVAGRVSTGDETSALIISRKLQDLQPLAAEIVADSRRGISADARSLAVQVLIGDARVHAVQTRLNTLDDLLGTYDSLVTGTPRDETMRKRLEDEVEANRALYTAFTQQLASSQVSEAYAVTKAAGRLSIIEPPSRPTGPFKPNRTAYAMIATLLGFMLGIGALAIVERQDVTLRDSREAERMLGLRVVATIPQIESVSRLRKEKGLWTPGRLEEFLHDSPAYQELRRVSLELRNDEESPVRSLLVTSARGGEGKTTISLLLAAVAASEEPRVPVLVVDLDFRRGSLGRLLDIKGDTPGVSQALEFRRIEEGMFLKTSLPNLHVLPLGGEAGPRNDLLTFESLSWLLPELTRRYGLVVIDSPPNVPVPDALIIGQLVDAVFIVVKAGSTSRQLIERGVELQKQFTGNVRGILMNNVDEIMPYYYSHRYYGYPYGAKRG
jgi:capsular exopolysaccharide synthesis family protein